MIYYLILGNLEWPLDIWIDCLPTDNDLTLALSTMSAEFTRCDLFGLEDIQIVTMVLN